MDVDEKREPATYADIEALPPGVTGELIDGVLYTAPRPAVRHASVMLHMTSQLYFQFQQGQSHHGGWWFLPEPELHLGRNVFVPDIAGWRVESMPQVPLQQSRVHQAPDWIAEITSPSTAQYDREVKLMRYYEQGVKWVWLVSPTTRLVEVVRHAPDGWYLAGAYGERDAARIEPFGDAAFDLTTWWGPR